MFGYWRGTLIGSPHHQEFLPEASPVVIMVEGDQLNTPSTLSPSFNLACVTKSAFRMVMVARITKGTTEHQKQCPKSNYLLDYSGHAKINFIWQILVL